MMITALTWSEKKEAGMEAIECIKTRRSVRKYTDEMVPVETVREIVELASYSPSWKNTQVIRYTLVEDSDIIARIAAEGVMDFPLNQKTVSRAKQLMVITKKDGICGYEKNGYSVELGAAVTGQPLYQPEAFGVDTISHQSNEDNFNPDNYYYMEKSEYTITFDSDGLVSFICTWPMRSDEDAVQAVTLINWEDAVDSLQKCMPEHFADYRGYNKVEFNDVRLTYFRTKIGDGEYEAIPVYAFAQLDTDRGSDESYPIQLIMIDARDGSEVSVVQDEARFGKN